MIDNRSLASFAANYSEARAKFLDAAQARGAVLETYRHPLRTSTGDELTTDVAIAGEANRDRTLMIVSATHGVEGYAGSACQVDLLRSELFDEIVRSARLILVHAINPFGFAYSRRANEDNVDLNRNFVDFSQPRPVNAAYRPFSAQYLPHEPELESYLKSRERLEQEAADRGGYQFFKLATQPGQYEFPQGLFYGGTGPTWSNRTFMALCNRHFHGIKRAAVLDVHTGLGEPGMGEVIFLDPAAMGKYGHCLHRPVSCAGSRASVSARIEGPLLTAACEQLHAEMKICCALEFGTVPLSQNVAAKIFENWTFHHRPTDDPLRREAAARMRGAYFCDNDVWKDQVLTRGAEVIRDLYRCLLAAPATTSRPQVDNNRPQ